MLIVTRNPIWRTAICVKLLLLPLVAVSAGAGAPVTITLQSDADTYTQDAPILLRLIAKNDGSQTTQCPFRDNRGFRSADFVVEIRHDGEPVATRVFRRSNVKGGGYELSPGADLRAEFTLMPGLTNDETFEPLPAGGYKLVARITWGESRLESAPINIRIVDTNGPEPSSPNGVNLEIIKYIEDAYWMRLPCPKAADEVIRKKPDSTLAIVIGARQLVDRWRRLSRDRELSSDPTNYQQALEGLERDISRFVDKDNTAHVVHFSGELYFVLAESQLALANLAIREKDLRRVAMDDETRTKWRDAWNGMSDAIRELQQTSPESSFNQDAHELLSRQTTAIRRTLEKSPESPNAPELRASLSMVERLSATQPLRP